MKQTAVEWLANEFYEKLEVKGDGALFNDLVDQAKEMEKQQQGYSEEDMLKSFMAGIKCESNKGKNFEQFIKQFKNK
jgi:PBP1b-binding outer membrane lipoprotein LpoB